MTPPLLENQLDAIVRSLRAQPLRLKDLPFVLRKQAPLSDVRFVPGSAQASYILRGLGLAVVVQPAVAESRVLALLTEIANRPDVQAVLLVDGRWQMAAALPYQIANKPFRFQVLAGAR